MKNLLYVIALLFTIISCTAEPDRTPSAAANVTVLTTTFTIPGLDRQRTVRLYLPPGYNNSANQRYPVLYMHDGQNLFDKSTAYAGEWQVDEILNQLATADQLQLIVVGIDNGGEHRMTELNPHNHAEYGKSEAAAYLALLRDVVKPYIDQHYRTLPDAANTGIMGSSMGGLFSHFAALEAGDTFSKIGIFSPSYWITDTAVTRYQQSPVPVDARWYFYVGGDEGGGMAEQASQVYQAVDKLPASQGQRQFKLAPDAGHNEAAWAAEFRQAVLWLYAKP
ncbi:alpha/beta hydrolase-fold protein [Rheinheimera sp. F8]|uniref:alpha/beta hydrolase n=1 Tax=Rheinheimera sp. F8 TaxID=1763998 RepID=UPI0007448D02|nr:alpha/beta hydrolase-fold protein [Rheinheimera sp. F8]ALZ75876.1 esterase [Rheinheimera sp. F8]